jgi:hypothetical protein
MTKTSFAVVVLAAAAAAGCGSESGDDAGASTAEREKAARQLVLDVDQGQLCHRKFYGGYTDSAADLELMVGGRIAGPASTHRLDVDIDASAGGRSYIVRVRGNGVDTFFSRRGSDFAEYPDARTVPPNVCKRDKPSPYRPRTTTGPS